PDVIATAVLGVPVDRTYTLTNLLGDFTGRAVGTALDSAQRSVGTITNKERISYTVVVPQGATSLRATIGGASDPGADLDLFVFKDGVQVASSDRDGSSEESVTVSNPAAGTYTVQVMAYSVPAGSTTYNYLDAFAHSMFGAVALSDANALRAAGSSWTVPGTVTVNAVPGVGRVLLGTVQVLGDDDMLIGSDEVVIEAVTGSGPAPAVTTTLPASVVAQTMQVGAAGLENTSGCRAHASTGRMRRPESGVHFALDSVFVPRR